MRMPVYFTVCIYGCCLKHDTDVECSPQAFRAAAVVSSASAVRGFGRSSPEGHGQQWWQYRQSVTHISVRKDSCCRILSCNDVSEQPAVLTHIT